MQERITPIRTPGLASYPCDFL